MRLLFVCLQRSEWDQLERSINDDEKFIPFIALRAALLHNSSDDLFLCLPWPKHIQKIAKHYQYYYKLFINPPAIFIIEKCWNFLGRPRLCKESGRNERKRRKTKLNCSSPSGPHHSHTLGPINFDRLRSIVIYHWDQWWSMVIMFNTWLSTQHSVTCLYSASKLNSFHSPQPASRCSHLLKEYLTRFQLLANERGDDRVELFVRKLGELRYSLQWTLYISEGVFFQPTYLTAAGGSHFLFFFFRP